MSAIDHEPAAADVLPEEATHGVHDKSTPVERAAEAIQTRQWREGADAIALMTSHAEHQYDYACAICRPDLDNDYERVVRAALDAAVDVDELARALNDHRWMPVYLRCRCDWIPSDTETHDQHQADAVRAHLLGGAR